MPSEIFFSPALPRSSFLVSRNFFSILPKKSLLPDSADFILRAIALASRLLFASREKVSQGTKSRVVEGIPVIAAR